ncbi:calcium/sodium antiporter [Desulfovibrio psychrotolerans]|uniref:Sodium:calcium antiporter n=1 Tax=Desulfovibrio psychrotolerans TaxID=415242 RepID=A0A7J0BQT8_9BACT|nr:calcium/sodium antiporter [Desulfovibrio psychrotolerans]GFM35434.1 sodium:calcium antiporter [Desulfovibrio psychrotolerans]
MLHAIGAIVFGLCLLVWSADRFVDGASATARHFGMSPLLVGIVIVGFGTSLPEMLVSVQSSLQGNPGIALGNAYGSNIANIALILGIAALICPMAVHARVLRRELPLLLAVSGLSVALLWDGHISRLDALAFLGIFFLIMGWSVVQALHSRVDFLVPDADAQSRARSMALRTAIFWLVAGAVVLAISSRMLVWGAVLVAQAFGVSDLIIGLTVIAMGTSLPELASSVAAAVKREHDIAIGNVLGSNLFNTLAVVGLAGSLHPLDVEQAVLFRDMPVMIGLTLSLMLVGLWPNPRLNRLEGLLLLAVYIGYMSWLVVDTLG